MAKIIEIKIHDAAICNEYDGLTETPYITPGENNLEIVKFTVKPFMAEVLTFLQVVDENSNVLFYHEEVSDSEASPISNPETWVLNMPDSPLTLFFQCGYVTDGVKHVTDNEEVVFEPKSTLKLTVVKLHENTECLTYDVLAEETPLVRPGTRQIHFAEGFIQAQLIGPSTTGFIEVVDDRGNILYLTQKSIGFGGTISNSEFYANMPDRNYVLTVNVGVVHQAAREVTDSITFTVVNARKLIIRVNNSQFGTTDNQFPPGEYLVPANSQLTITATPNEGYSFHHWLLNGVILRDNPLTIVISQDYALAAFFYPLLSVNSIPTGIEFQLTPKLTGQTETHTTPYSEYRQPGSYLIEFPETYTAPDGHIFKFDYMTINETRLESNSAEFVLNQKTEIIAYYIKTTVELTIEVNNPDWGTTNDNYPPGTRIVAKNSLISVTAIPKGGAKFNYWVKDGETIEQNPIEFIITDDTRLTAYFEPPPTHKVSVDSEPQGVPFSVYKDSEKVGDYVTPTELELEEATYTFEFPKSITDPQTNHEYQLDRIEYNGETTTENRLTITVTEDLTIKAYYTLIICHIVIQVNNPDWGTTNDNYPPGEYDIPKNETITVTAIPAEGYEFDYWLIDGETRTENPLTIIVDRNLTLTAYFKEYVPPEYATLAGKVKSFLGAVSGADVALDNIYRAKTDKDGNFRIENIELGNYIIRVEHWLYEPFITGISLNEPKEFHIEINLSLKSTYVLAGLGAFAAIALGYNLWSTYRSMMVRKVAEQGKEMGE